MPSVTEKQRKFMGAELDRKRSGKQTQTDMNEQQLSEYASKPLAKSKVVVDGKTLKADSPWHSNKTAKIKPGVHITKSDLEKAGVLIPNTYRPLKSGESPDPKHGEKLYVGKRGGRYAIVSKSDWSQLSKPIKTDRKGRMKPRQKGSDFDAMKRIASKDKLPAKLKPDIKKFPLTAVLTGLGAASSMIDEQKAVTKLDTPKPKDEVDVLSNADKSLTFPQDYMKPSDSKVQKSAKVESGSQKSPGLCKAFESATPKNTPLITQNADSKKKKSIKASAILAKISKDIGGSMLEGEHTSAGLAQGGERKSMEAPAKYEKRLLRDRTPKENTLQAPQLTPHIAKTNDLANSPVTVEKSVLGDSKVMKDTKNDVAVGAAGKDKAFTSEEVGCYHDADLVSSITKLRKYLAGGGGCEKQAAEDNMKGVVKGLADMTPDNGKTINDNSTIPKLGKP